MSIYLRSKKDFMNFAIMIFCFFFIFSCLTVTDIKAQTLLSEKIVWKPAEYVDPRKEVKVIPFKIKGPGVLQINSTIEPFFCVNRPMRYDGVFGIPGIWNYDWKLVKNKHLYDGKPGEHYNVAPPCYLEGKIKKATFFDEFEIPAKQYSGEFVITSPMSCSFNSCDRRGATFWAEVKFIPGSTTPSGEGEKESYLPGGPEVNGTSWIVNNHPVPWVFRSDGTVEAPNLWKGTWRRTNEGYWVNIGNGADVFLVKFSPDGKSFTAYKNGAVYRRGVFKSSSPDIQSSEPPQQKTVYFEKPTYKGYRLDICRLWGAECGKEAADAFCRIKGFTHSESWEIEHDIGHIYPTIIISSEQICNQSFCDGFKFIKCAGSEEKTKVLQNTTITGTYRCREGLMTFVQEQTSVTGTYNWSGGGRTSGRMIGDEYHGNFWDKVAEGDFIYRFTPDRSSFQMDWRLKGETKWRDGGRCERR